MSEIHTILRCLCPILFLVSDPPNTLEISDVSNRSMAISWTKPTKSYGEILGYVLQLRDSTQKCQSEVFIKCSDCLGTIVSKEKL